MKEIDYFDQQLLGYLRIHPDALFRDAARDLGAYMLVVDHRVQKLLHLGFLSVEPQGTFHLTEKAAALCSFRAAPAAEAPASSEFFWEDLYIPLEFISE